MTFVTKIRGAGGLIVAEYICPEHGRFELTVGRDANGDPPTTAPCPFPLGDHCPCEEVSDFAISAPQPKVLSVPAYATVRGGDLKERPPGMLDTRPLAEGMPMSQWKKLQQKQQDERRHQRLIAKGMKQKRVQVG